MLKIKSLLLSVFAFSLISVSSARAESVWIVSASGTLATYDTQAVTGGTVSAINFGTGIGHSIGNFELMVFGSYLSSSAGSFTISLMEVVGQLNFVLIGDHANAFYIGPRAGYQSINNGSTTSKAQLFGGTVGKRFELFKSLSYDPNVSATFTKDTSGTSSPKFHIVPIQLTLTF